MHEFQVLGSNPSNEGTSHVWKVSVTTQAIEAPAVEGTVVKDDLKRFDIVERAYHTKDKTTGEEITLMLKWLHVKQV